MDKTLVILVAAWVMMGAVAWLMGYYYGARTLRNRNRQLLTAIEKSNQIYKDWKATEEGTSWEDGYATGIRNTLDTLSSFLKRASDT